MKAVILILSIVIIAFYLITEHKAHLYGISQYLIFGLFILMHLFMHAGHSGHGTHKDQKKKGSHHG